MRRVTMFLLFVFVLPAMADSECPIGYAHVKYTQLEYIESTGTQYIDTGIKPLSGDRFVANFAATTFDSSYRSIFGAANSGQDIDFYVSLQVSAGYFFNAPFTLPELNVNTRYEVILSDNALSSLVINDVTVLGAKVWHSDDVSLLLFARNTTNAQAIGRFYGFNWFREGVQICNLIPAKRISDGAVGMWDTVSQTFFTNDGTGDFVAGPEVLGGYFYAVDGECSPCPPNTYKDFVGNGECTPCPDAMVSPSGSKSATDCGRALWVGGKVLFMSSAPRTTTTLNVMDSDGNIFYGNLYSEK